MRQAARDVNVLDFIESLPHGFDEPVRERGNSLSTGQKQLINFARALAYNPRILILDEATSSVDTDTELRIRGALERMVEGRTSVLIAHRLSTVQRADTILVMHKGQLARDGLAPGTAGAARPLLEALPVAVQGSGNWASSHRHRANPRPPRRFSFLFPGFALNQPVILSEVRHCGRSRRICGRFSTRFAFTL